MYELTEEEQKLEMIRVECGAMWEYLEFAIQFIEEKQYLKDGYDVNELLAYCRSCGEIYENIKTATFELVQEIRRLHYE